MIILAYILSGLSLLMSVLFLIQTKNPVGWIVLAFKLTAAALSPFWAIMGIAGAITGWVYQALWAIPMGLVGVVMMIWYIWQTTRDHTGFDEVFGAGWSDRILPEQAGKMVRRRWPLFLKMKASPEPLWERDMAFWTIPGTDRELLCDLWCPAGEDVSGLAFVYFHGGGWWIWDKDYYKTTRPLFSHLIAQGHTVMDVAYRLCPEVDIYDMLGDVKRAIAWMKANASTYGIDSEKIVLGGGSAGAHLALLAGYTPEHPELTPEDIKDADLSVCGVISHYGPTDLLAAYQHENQQQLVGLPPVPIGPDSTASRHDYGRMDVLLGGHPQDAPETYQLASPITHVHPGCPPTLLIQGKQDFITPVDATCELHAGLVECGVPAINIAFPWTDHGFDLAFPRINPAAQSALYDVDRFLALLVNKDSGVRQQPNS